MDFKVICIGLLLMKAVASGASFNDSSIDNTAHYLQQSSIVYALSTLAQNASINSECSHQLQQFQQQSLNKTAWAMKMLDASGRSMPGFLFGHSYWLGDRQICEAVQNPVRLLITEHHKRRMHWGILNETAPFDVGFFVAHLKHKSPWQVEMKLLPSEGVLHIGLCAPVACEVDDLKALIEQFLKGNFHEAINFYDMSAKLISVNKLNSGWLPGWKFFQNAVFIFLACLTSLTSLLVLCAAILAQQQCKKEGKLIAFVKCFNLAANARKIFAAEVADIPVINGLRVAVSVAVVFVHVTFFQLPVVVNQPMVLKNIGNNLFLLTHIVVDYFFTISGFLQAYKFFSNPQQLKTISEAGVLGVCKEFLKKLFHRWLRLAPLFYTLVCLDVLIVTFIDSGGSVYPPVIRDDFYFPQSWWRYVLFIHNFTNVLQMAACWTWSMGCEMQFFIVGTFLLLIYAKKPIVAKTGFLAMLLANFGIHFYNGISDQFGINADDLVPTTNAMYMNPLVRCTPYLLGIFCGWYSAIPKKRLSNFTERVIGNLCLILVGVLLAAMPADPISPGAVPSAILIVARIAMSLWTSWLIIAGLTNRKTWLALLLELNCFRPLARLSYAFYLLHPCIILFVGFTTNSGLHLNEMLLVILHAGFVAVSYMGALIVSLAYEIPYCNLSSLIIKRKL